MIHPRIACRCSVRVACQARKESRVAFRIYKGPLPVTGPPPSKKEISDAEVTVSDELISRSPGDDGGMTSDETLGVNNLSKPIGYQLTRRRDLRLRERRDRAEEENGRYDKGGISPSTRDQRIPPFMSHGTSGVISLGRQVNEDLIMK